MTWAARRRVLIIFIVLITVSGLAFWHYSPVILKAPTCTDGVKNGEETGIDCGGSMCTNLCTADVRLPTVLWSRAFPVTEDVYNVAAAIENKNDAATRSIPYEFRLYDKDNVLLARRGGMALVPPIGRYDIVETGIPVGTGRVSSTTFSFSTSPALWERIPDDISRLRVSTSNISLDTTGVVPKLSATLLNPSPTLALDNTVVAAVLYDANDNAVNVSKTLVPTLAPGARAQAVFTWPRAFGAAVVRYEIVPIIDVFHTK